MSKVVEITNLSKDYEVGFWKKKKVRALDDLNLSVDAGQIFGFLGGNGAGKTTTIKILMTLLYPTTGTARILGQGIAETAMHNRIGYCPENPYFYDYLTAVELMDYFGSLFGMEQNARKQRSEELLKRVGLDEKAWNKQLRKFSKGMMQRVSIAQSLINDPELVFMDEPMSGLDPMGRREIRELISDLRKAGKTVFMSTHILSDVEALCDEVAILNKGRLAATGKLDDLLASHAGDQIFEINLRGINGETLSGLIDGNFDLENTSGGVRVRVNDEGKIEGILSAAHSKGGRLISVTSVKQSLEELFISKTED